MPADLTPEEAAAKAERKKKREKKAAAEAAAAGGTAPEKKKSSSSKAKTGGSAGSSAEPGSDIWSSIVADRKASGEGEPAAGRESTVILVGNKQVGKSTLVSRFLNPEKDDGPPKPSVALEYTFGRRSGAQGDVKDVAHIWELGGGRQVRRQFSANAPCEATVLIVRAMAAL